MRSKRPPFLLKPGEVHVWWFDLVGAPQEHLAWERLLSAVCAKAKAEPEILQYKTEAADLIGYELT